MHKLDPKAVWLFFINYLWGWFLFFLLVGWWIPFMFEDQGISYGSIFPQETWIWFFGIIIILTGLSYLLARLSYHFYRYEIADIGFKKEHGIIWKRYVTIPYDRIQNVDVYRGIWARLLGLSDLQIKTAGFSSAKGLSSEGRLPGLSKEVAEQLRDELLIKARESRIRTNQGL